MTLLWITFESARAVRILGSSISGVKGLTTHEAKSVRTETLCALCRHRQSVRVDVRGVESGVTMGFGSGHRVALCLIFQKCWP